MHLPFRRPWTATEALAIAWISTVVLIAATLLGFKWIGTQSPPPPPVQVRVDTVRSVVYDTVTVIARARDTVRIVEQQVGPLTEERVARLICGSQKRIYGDKRDVFGFNQLGMIFCPK